MNTMDKVFLGLIVILFIMVIILFILQFTSGLKSLNVRNGSATTETKSNWKKLKELYTTHKKTRNFETLLDDMTFSEAKYNEVKTELTSLTALITSGFTDRTGRILVTLPDGTVYFDSSKTNTWTSARAKTINENHNSRPSIMAAQLLPSGEAYETKYSTSTSRYEDYVSFRIGKIGLSCGTLRYSVS
jgi:hypothetical protein